MTSVSTHVIDNGRGRPAVGLKVTLDRLVNGVWTEVREGVTDENGRIPSLARGLDPGRYRMVFSTGEYGSHFYPEVHVVVDLDDGDEHYHIPLLLSAYGYTTYRGS